MGFGEIIAELFPLIVLFCGIVGLMVVESYILTREKYIVYAMLALSLIYHVAEFFESILAQEPVYHYGRSIFSVMMRVVIPYIPLLFFYLVAKPGRWANSLIALPIAETGIFVYSLFSQRSAVLPNLGIEYTINNEPIYGKLFGLSIIAPIIPLLLTIIFLAIGFIKKKVALSSLLIGVFVVVANITAWIIELLVPSTYLIGKIVFLSIIVYYAYLYIYYLKVHQEEVLQKSEIDIMISQIHPHFLYNTLNSIYYLCGKDDDLAKKTIDDFSTYLRLNLRSLTNKDAISITEELHHVETYLNIEKLRFGDRLNFDFQIEAQDFKVPALILQPLVENAVKHGICGKENGGTVIIKIYREESKVIIKIIDDGVGFDMNAVDLTKGDHVGFTNTKKRIEMMLHGTLEVQSEVGKGTEITIVF